MEPRAGRVAVFDGRYLHGVIPGRGPSPRLPRNHPGRAAGFFPCGRSDCDARRITLMVAFWDEFAARPGGDGSDPRASFPKGSGRPFPDPKLYLGDRSRPKGIDWPEMFHAMHLTSMPDVVAEAAGTRDDDDDEGGGGAGAGGGGEAGTDAVGGALRDARGAGVAGRGRGRERCVLPVVGAGEDQLGAAVRSMLHVLKRRVSTF